MPEAKGRLHELARSARADVLGWLWDAQSEAVLLHDGDGRVLDANRAACQMLGATRDELLGLGPDDPLWRRVERVEGGPLPAVELPAMPRRASPFPERARLVAIRAPGRDEVVARMRGDHRRTADGTPLTLVTFVDVTAEVAAQRAAQAARGTIERIAESVEEFLFTAELCRDGSLRLTYAGPGIERLLGGMVPAGTAPEAAWFAAMHPDDLGVGRRALRAAAAGEPVSVEYRLVGLDGRTRWVRTRTTLRVEDDGTFIDGIASDITATHRHEVELARFRAIVEASRACIAVLDRRWRLRWMNRAGLEMTGLAAEAVAGMPFELLLPPEARAQHFADERPQVEREGHWRGETLLQPLDLGRGPVHVEATSYLIDEPAGGAPLGVVVMRNDIGALRHLAREHEAIGNVATLVASGAEAGAVFQAASREVAELLEADAGGVAELAGAGTRILACWPPGTTPSPELRRGIEQAGQAAAAGAGAQRLALGDQHCLAAPVRVEGRPWGVLAAAREREPYGEEDERAVARLADIVAAAVELARARALLLEQAATDGLTGLCNHRAFHEHLREEAGRAQRYDRALALVLLDLDEFKEVNDRHGHQTGDRLLQDVAGALRGEVRGTEIVARLGGDEFALLLPETDLDGAHATAERVRHAIESLPIAEAHGVSASAGVAELAQAAGAEELVRLADGALYWSKVNGRNRVSAYDPDRVEALSAQERAERLARTHALGAVRVLARLIDLKDRSTHRHSERVAELAVLLAEELGWPEERRALLRDAALVHDVGKVVVPEVLLAKPGPLSPEEFEHVKRHAATGAQIAAEALGHEQALWIRQHHERPDGGGYPDGLAEQEISEGARVLALADGWDVMTSERPYQAAKPPSDALEECRGLAGRQFDAQVLEALERLCERGAVPIA